MSIGMATYERIKKAESKANSLGFSFKSDQYGRGRDMFVLVANNDIIPTYRHGAEIFNGSLEEVEAFIIGIEWARSYDSALGLKTTERRTKAETRLKNAQLVELIAGK